MITGKNIPSGEQRHHEQFKAYAFENMQQMQKSIKKDQSELMIIDGGDASLPDQSFESTPSSYQEGDAKRISSSSRVNFSKLTKKEQAIRFKNMQKKIQRLQIQVRSLKIHNGNLRDKIRLIKKGGAPTISIGGVGCSIPNSL